MPRSLHVPQLRPNATKSTSYFKIQSNSNEIRRKSQTLCLISHIFKGLWLPFKGTGGRDNTVQHKSACTVNGSPHSPVTGFPSHSRGKVQVLTKVHKAYLAVCPAYHSMLSSCSLLLSSCSLLLADSTLATSDSPDLLPLQVLCPYLCLCLGCSHPAPASSSAAPSLPQVFIHIPPSADVLAPPLCSTVMTPPPADI